MRLLVSIMLIGLLIVSCTPQKRLNRLVTKHPELVQETIDTLRVDTIIPIPSKTAEFTFPSELSITDTIIRIENGIKLLMWRDTTNNHTDSLHVKAISLPDSVTFKADLPYTRGTIKVETKSESHNIIIAAILFLAIILIITIALVVKKLIS